MIKRIKELFTYQLIYKKIKHIIFILLQRNSKK